MAKDIEFEFVDTKKKFLNVFLSKKIAYINKLRAAFGAWRRLVAYRRLMNESDDDSDMPPLVDSSDMSSDSDPYSVPDEYESDSDFDPAFDMKNAAKLDVSYYVVITVGDLLQRRRRATPSSDMCGLASDDGNVSQVTADGGNVSQLAANLHTLAPVNDHTSSSTGSRADSTPLTDRQSDGSV